MDEILAISVKLYQRRNNKWFIAGYKCPHCLKHYHSLRKEFYTHVNSCQGTVRSLGEE